MAHSITHDQDLSVDDAVRALNSERTRRSWIALILFVLSGAAVITGFYLSYRHVPAPATPANATPALVEPYR
jgi:hypothetical protein